MKIMGNGMKIMIPTTSAKAVGLREVIMEKEIPRVYEILRNKDVTIDKQTLNKRYREYLEKIKTGSVFEIASVLRDLFLHAITLNLHVIKRLLFAHFFPVLNSFNDSDDLGRIHRQIPYFKHIVLPAFL
jgi:RNA polymerase-interacting CarD/CdnL/TRCF family regulator